MRKPKRISTRAIVWALVALAVLVAIAIPMYHRQLVRERLIAALNAADGAKLVVMEAATLRGGLARISASDLAFDGGSSLSPYVAKLELGADGRIVITTHDTGASPDPVLLLTPIEAASAQKPGPITWTCSVLTGDARMAPGACTAPTRAAPSQPPVAGRQSPAASASAAAASSRSP